MTVLWSKCGDIVYTVVIVWCHCGGTVVAVPLWAMVIVAMGRKVVAQ